MSDTDVMIGPGQTLHAAAAPNIEAMLAERLEESSGYFLASVRDAKSWATVGRYDLMAESVRYAQGHLKRLALQVGQLRAEMRLRGVWVEEEHAVPARSA